MFVHTNPRSWSAVHPPSSRGQQARYKGAPQDSLTGTMRAHLAPALPALSRWQRHFRCDIPSETDHAFFIVNPAQMEVCYELDSFFLMSSQESD